VQEAGDASRTTTVNEPSMAQHPILDLILWYRRICDFAAQSKITANRPNSNNIPATVVIPAATSGTSGSRST
jgi:hypothetical protein